MNSPFANMLSEIMARIKSQLPDVRYINADLGQLDFYETRPAVSFPCVLIDFENFTFAHQGEACQMAEGTVKVRLAHTPFSNSSSINDTEVREKALSYLDTEYRLNRALHAWQGESFGYLMRVAADTEKREDDIRVRELRYTTCFQDNSASPTYTPLPLDTTANMVAEGLTGNVLESNP